MKNLLVITSSIPTPRFTSDKTSSLGKTAKNRFLTGVIVLNALIELTDRAIKLGVCMCILSSNEYYSLSVGIII